MYKNHGNPKKTSDFICLKCLQRNVKGMDRKRIRERFHVKDLYCIYCLDKTKQIEMRYCDYFPEVMAEAKQLQMKYYGGDENDCTNNQVTNA